METFIVLVIFSFLIVNFGVNLFLSILNYKNRNAKIPEELVDIYDMEKYVDWKNYYMENFFLQLISSSINFIIILMFLSLSIFNKLYTFATDITMNVPHQSLIVIGFYFLINYVIDLIFSYYSVFTIENKYGFNKMTKKTFIIDKIKSLILTIIFGGGAVYGIVQLYLSSGNLFFFIAWGSSILIMLFINISYTKLFVPLFNKLRPLDDSPLKDKIYAFAEKVGYEISKISVIDASKRSTKLNAYFSGFGKVKRIVLYDTLIEKMSEEEIIAVLAHEIGHNKHKHIIFNLIQMVLMLSIYMLGIMIFLDNEVFSLAFDFSEISYGFNLILYMIFLSVVTLIINIPLSYISRKFEYQADAYAAQNYSDEMLISALKVLSRENFSNLTPHPLYVKFYYSHPPLKERIANIKSLKKDKS
ncbi:MAG: M48 family metallopeptidase [Candidatus Izemoplasmatales bacterium]|jgi:STE24 endopeptidase|nr:M48 family metallopeptidase [Candidatus Izemoplasmatales bacterium]